MDAVPFTIDQVGTVSLMLAFIIALVRGWLVTKREADSYRHDRDNWRTAYENETKVNDTQTRQLDQLLDASKTSRAFLEGIQKVIEK